MLLVSLRTVTYCHAVVVATWSSGSPLLSIFTTWELSNF